MTTQINLNGTTYEAEYNIIKPGNRPLEPRHIQLEAVTCDDEEAGLASSEREEIRRRIFNQHKEGV